MRAYERRRVEVQWVPATAEERKRMRHLLPESPAAAAAALDAHAAAAMASSTSAEAEDTHVAHQWEGHSAEPAVQGHEEEEKEEEEAEAETVAGPASPAASHRALATAVFTPPPQASSASGRMLSALASPEVQHQMHAAANAAAAAAAAAATAVGSTPELVAATEAAYRTFFLQQQETMIRTMTLGAASGPDASPLAAVGRFADRIGAAEADGPWVRPNLALGGISASGDADNPHTPLHSNGSGGSGGYGKSVRFALKPKKAPAPAPAPAPAAPAPGAGGKRAGGPQATAVRTNVAAKSASGPSALFRSLCSGLSSRLRRGRDGAFRVENGVLLKKTLVTVTEPAYAYSPLLLLQAYGRALVDEMPLLRIGVQVTMALVVYYLRIVIMAKGYALGEWANPIHNSFFHTKDPVVRLLSIAMVQAYALSKLVFPIFLSHEHNALKKITGFSDYRNTITAVVWTSIILLVTLSFRYLARAMARSQSRGALELLREQARTSGRGKGARAQAPAIAAPAANSSGSTGSSSASGKGTVVSGAYAEYRPGDTTVQPPPVYSAEWLAGCASRLLFGLGFVFIAYLPSSHAVQYVAFLLAERTLFLPSFGSVVIMAELIAIAGEILAAKKQELAAAQNLGGKSHHRHGHHGHGHREGAEAKDGKGRGKGAAHTDEVVTRGPSGKVAVIRLVGVTPLPTAKKDKERHAADPSFSSAGTPSEASSPQFAASAEDSFREAMLGDEDVSGASAAKPRGCCMRAVWGVLQALFALFPSLPRRRVSKSLTLPGALLSTLSAYFVWRTYTRNFAWLSEESLMLANLELYPDNNWMTVYGLGAVALYAGRVDEAERYLLAAGGNSSMVEPHVLLSQLEWKFRANDGGYERAEKLLRRVAESNTPRKEILTNLGMLMMSRLQDEATEEENAEAEYYILAAYQAHGYPRGHTGIATIANNAACIRLLSDPHRYGNVDFAREAFEDGLQYARFGGSSGLYKNAALFYAIQGDAENALAILAEGSAAIESYYQEMNRVSSDPSYPGSRQQLLGYIGDMYVATRNLQLSITLHRVEIERWRKSSVPPLGKVAIERMNYLGTECYLEMLWW
jgi:hypothetical protein